MRRKHGALAMTLLLAAAAGGVIAATTGMVGSAASHKEVAPIGQSKGLRLQALSNFCLNDEGNLLVCEYRSRKIKVVSPKGKLLATWRLDLTPQAIHARPDGTVYVGGAGKLAKLDKTGKVIKTADLKAKGRSGLGIAVAGIAATGKDVFVSHRARTGFAVSRFDEDLGRQKQIVSGLRGCCGQMDICARDGVLYAAENGRHRIVRYDRDGKVLSTWGKRSRKDVRGFGGCCNPMNLCFGPDGSLYTAETTGGRVKKYTPEGKFLGLVGTTKVSAGCIRVRVAVSKDGNRVYVFDKSRKLIRVLEKRSANAREPRAIGANGKGRSVQFAQFADDS